MHEVLAGFVMGYLLAIIWTGLVTVVLARWRRTVTFVRQVIPLELSMVAVAVPLFSLAFLWGTAFGIVMGLIYGGVEDRMPSGGLGSPNLVFTLGVIVSACVPLVVAVSLAQRGYWPFLAMVVSYTVLFGWGMPLLAAS